MFRLILMSAVILGLLGSHLTALANNSCLENATNQDLLKELRFRLNSGGGSLSASFLCGPNATVSVSTVNLSTGETGSYSLATGNWDTCNNLVALLNSKIGAAPINKSFIFAACVTNATLVKVLVSTEVGVKEAESIRTGNWDVCNDTAARINSAL